MKERLTKAVQDAANLTEVGLAIIQVCQELRARGFNRIGYVAGPVTADGSEFISRNIRRLHLYTSAIEAGASGVTPIFSCTYVFTPELFARIDTAGAKNGDYEIMWQQVLKSGQITDVFMTSGWERSHGATDEHNTAQQLGLRIHYV